MWEIQRNDRVFVSLGDFNQMGTHAGIFTSGKLRKGESRSWNSLEKQHEPTLWSEGQGQKEENLSSGIKALVRDPMQVKLHGEQTHY